MKPMATTLLLTLAAMFSRAAEVTLTPEQRLQPEHLKKANEARLRFAKERKTDTFPNHGAFKDFRAILNVVAESEAARDEILAAAKSAGAKIVQFADPKKLNAEALRGERDGVLFFTATEA